MNEEQIKDLHRTLRQPTVFQSKYGDSANTIFGVTLPDSLWEGITLKGWTFKNVTFKGTKWHHVKVVDGVFDGCDFVETEFMNNTFVNTQFRHPVFKEGVWDSNQFLGGTIDGMQIKFYEMGTIRWEHNHFEDMLITNNQPNNNYDNRNGWWRECSFKKCTIKNNSFYFQVFDSCTWDSCTFSKNDFGYTDFKGASTRVSYCTSTDDDGMTIGTGEGSIDHSTYKTEGFGGHKLSHVNVDAMNKGEITLAGGSDVQARNGTDLYAVGIENGVIENINAEGKPLRNVMSVERCKNITIRNVRAETAYIEDVEDAVFENIEMDELIGQTGCKRCTFRNVLIKKRIFLGPGDVLDFEDCKFENMKRAANVPVVRIDRDRNKTNENMILPWEQTSH